MPIAKENCCSQHIHFSFLHLAITLGITKLQKFIIEESAHQIAAVQCLQYITKKGKLWSMHRMLCKEMNGSAFTAGSLRPAFFNQRSSRGSVKQ